MGEWKCRSKSFLRTSINSDAEIRDPLRPHKDTIALAPKRRILRLAIGGHTRTRVEFVATAKCANIEWNGLPARSAAWSQDYQRSAFTGNLCGGTSPKIGGATDSMDPP